MEERTTAKTEEVFYSPTRGELNLSQVFERIRNYMEQKPDYNYRLVIGTDSLGCNHRGVDFVTALVVHRVGGGGIYFWKKKFGEVHSLRERIYEEASLSLSFAQELLNRLQGKSFLDYDFEIHVDVGENGDTRDMLAEVVGMIRGSGFSVKTKPEAYGASSVADRHA
ncbi:MAG: ribonuclease H-like YkuK family protein [Patescibacteria group bacterium]